MIKNPHPDAGKAEHYQNVGCIHECLPCLVKNRRYWAQRAQTAEQELHELKEATQPSRQMNILKALIATQAVSTDGLELIEPTKD